MNELQTSIFDYNALPVSDAAEVRAAAERIKVRLKRTAEDIIEIGKDLIAVKERLPHGDFESWIVSEFDMNERSAQRFMQVAEKFGDKNDKLSLLKPSALYALAAPSTPEEVRETVIAKAEAGESVSLKEIERLKQEVIAAKKQAEQANTKANEAVGRLNGNQQLLEMMTQKYDAVRAQKEVIVEKEVAPADYDDLKRHVTELGQERSDLQGQVGALKHRIKASEESLRKTIDAGVATRLREMQDKVAELDRAIAINDELLEKRRNLLKRFDADASANVDVQKAIDEFCNAVGIVLADLQAAGTFVPHDKTRHDIAGALTLLDQCRSAFEFISA